MGSKSIHWKSAICFFLAIVFVLLFYVYGMDRANYFMFKIGQGAFALLDSLECRFLFFYTVFSLYVALLFFLTLVYSHDTVSVLSFVARFLRQRHTLLIISLAAFGAMIATRFLLFHHTAMTDDENAYLFVARTLLKGRLINPSPEFYELFSNQFVYADQYRWFGQYLIGYPLFLAGGLLLGIVDLVVPLCGLATIGLCYLIARDMFDKKSAAITVVLLVLSPQFVLTSGTLLAYTTASFNSCLLIYSGLRLYSSGRWVWSASFFIASSLLILNRPMSWLSLGVVLGLYFVLLAVKDRTNRSLAAVILMFLAGLSSVVLFFVINYIQTGNPFETTVELYYRLLNRGALTGFGVITPWGLPHTVTRGLANAVLSASRQNIWLFGWPISFVFLFFIGRSRFARFLLVWLACFYGFHVYTYCPGILLTGPNHYFEMIIPAVLLSAHGIMRLHEILKKHISHTIRGEVVPCAVLSLFLCSFILFIPPALRTLENVANRASRVIRMLDQNNVHNAIVFINNIVSDHCHTWVYFPPNNSPDYAGEDRIYVRWPKDKLRLEKFVSQYPNRQVWGVLFSPKGQPIVAKRGTLHFSQWQDLVKLRFPSGGQCR